MPSVPVIRSHQYALPPPVGVDFGPHLPYLLPLLPFCAPSLSGAGVMGAEGGKDSRGDDPNMQHTPEVLNDGQIISMHTPWACNIIIPSMFFVTDYVIV